MGRSTLMPMSPRAYLSVRPLSFGHTLTQSEGIAWMKAALQRAAADGDRHARRGPRDARSTTCSRARAKIERRVTALEDYTHQDWDRMRLHVARRAAATASRAPSLGDWHRAPLDRRMALFAETAEAVARNAFADDAEAPDALVQVSCTGYDSPSAVQRVSPSSAGGRATRAC